MNLEKLEQFYSKLTTSQQQELNERLSSMCLAMDINPDQNFINECVEDLFKDYPELEKYSF